MTVDQAGIIFLVFILSMFIYTQSMQKKAQEMTTTASLGP